MSCFSSARASAPSDTQSMLGTSRFSQAARSSALTEAGPSAPERLEKPDSWPPAAPGGPASVEASGSRCDCRARNGTKRSYIGAPEVPACRSPSPGSLPARIVPDLTGLPQSTYPSCIAILGATREARRAGSHAASRPVIVSSTAAARRIRGSDGLISNTSDVSQRPSTSAPAMPATQADAEDDARPAAAPARVPERRSRRAPSGSQSPACAGARRRRARRRDRVRRAAETRRERAHQDERESLATASRDRRPRSSAPPGARPVPDPARRPRRARPRASARAEARLPRPARAPSSGCRRTDDGRDRRPASALRRRRARRRPRRR